jgi:predicted DCC family thiol-disulfide oxidoreductase YuxK
MIDGPVEGGHVVLFDGPCGLCNRTVRFLVRRDVRGQLRFATLQGAFAAGALKRHGRAETGDDSVCVLVDHATEGERLLRRSAAVFFLLRTLGGFWKMPALLSRLPVAWTDALYDWVARHRYRVFGRSAARPTLAREHRDRFLDD